MNNFLKKIKLIFIPYFLTSACIIGGYTLLNWLLCIKLNVISINEEIVNLWIPLFLPFLVVLIYIRPKFKLLNLKKDRGLYYFMVVSCIATCAPAVIAQSYLQTSLGKLTPLTNINQINTKPATKYYSLKNFYLDKNHIGVQDKFDVSGKYNQDFDMSIYIVVPIYASPKDTLKGTCVAWCGIEYDARISNDASREEKETGFKRFAETSQKDFNSKRLNQFVYLDRIGNTDNHKVYIEAINNAQVFLGGSNIVLLPVNEPFESRNGNKLLWLFGIFGIGMIVMLLMVTIPKFDKQKLKKLNAGSVDKKKDAKEIIRLFIPQKGFYVTPVLIDLNVLIFLIMVFSGLGFFSFSSEDLLSWGGNYGPLTKGGEWWRLITSTFLHGGLVHLVANMCALLFVGIYLEPKIGKNQYLFIYLITGIVASLASLWWNTSVVAIGASGAIFGLYGTFLALLILKVFPKDINSTFLWITIIFVGYNLLFGLIGNIDNAAHIGGLVSGFILGIVIAPSFKQEGNQIEEDTQNLLNVIKNDN